MKKVILYTDGACSGNPGPGGWSGSHGDPIYVPTRSPQSGNRSGMTWRPQPTEVSR